MKNRLSCLLLGACIWLSAGPALAAPADEAASWAQQNQSAAPLIRTHPNRFTYGKPWVLVGVKSQSLTVYDGYGREDKRYVVSTAKRGVGEQEGSYQTPRGWHRICQKIGDGAPSRTIIFRREITPWQYTEELHQQYPNKDWILTRIMWLCGMEDGFNKDGSVDSYNRYIYIHGAGDHTPFGTPSSLGCVRMQNDDVINLYNDLPVGTDVYIDENA